MPLSLDLNSIGRAIAQDQEADPRPPQPYGLFITIIRIPFVHSHFPVAAVGGRSPWLHQTIDPIRSASP